MKKKLFFIATSLYSNAQAVRASIKSVGYAIFAFIAATLMLLAPVSINKATTSGESLAQSFKYSGPLLYDAIVDLSNQGAVCEIKDGKFTCGGGVEDKIIVKSMVENKKETKYTFVFLDENYDYAKVDEKEPQLDDNIMYFGEETFYIRRTIRNDDKTVESTIYLEGNYSYVGSFNFQQVIDYIDVENIDNPDGRARQYLQSIYSDLLYAVSISDFNVTLILWFIMAIIVNLICIFSGGFILYYGNKKGNLADDYGFKGSLKIACNLLLLPAILCVLIGLFMPESVIITAPIIFFIRTFVIYRAQFTRKGQKLSIKIHKGLEEMID